MPRADQGAEHAALMRPVTKSLNLEHVEGVLEILTVSHAQHSLRHDQAAICHQIAQDGDADHHASWQDAGDDQEADGRNGCASRCFQFF